MSSSKVQRSLRQARAILRQAEDRLRDEQKRAARTRTHLPLEYVARLKAQADEAALRVAVLEGAHRQHAERVAAGLPQHPPSAPKAKDGALMSRLFQVAIEARLYELGIAPLQSLTKALTALDDIRPGWDARAEARALPVEGAEPEPQADDDARQPPTDDELLTFAEERRASFDVPAVAAHFGVAPADVTRALQRLAAAGWITRLMRGLYIAARVTTQEIRVEDDEGEADAALKARISAADVERARRDTRAQFERHEAKAATAPRSWVVVVPGPPVGKGRPRLGRGGHVITPQATRDYEARVASAARAAGVRAGMGPCSVSVCLWTETRRRADGDNFLKAILDGLVSAGPCVLVDDSCTIVTDARVRWMGVDKRNPRAEVMVDVIR